MSFDIEKFVIIDNHAHSILKDLAVLDEIGFRQCFSESRCLNILQDHVNKSVHYMSMLDHLLRIFGLKSEQEFLAFRMKQDSAQFVQMLWDNVSLGALVIDDGYNSGHAMNLEQLSKISGRPIFLCRRMEAIMESSILSAESFKEVLSNYKKHLLSSSKRKPVALKTICGYRGGLSLLDPTEKEAERDFDKIKKSLGETKTFRIEKSPLYHFLLRKSFEYAGQAELPVQIHSGIGDDDADLVECNPALMQPLFRDRRYSKTRFVLLHCYPYVREAAFMCSLYSNVFMDLSLSISLASPSSAMLIHEALSTAPSTKLLAGTDGHSCPESHWFGALNWKRGLSHALFEMINSGLVTQKEAEEIGALVLHDNAIKLYKLEGLA
ncbi:MAG: amidohydrolase family protein [Candidatus Obscuribacterales bacterium]|nr:amidohydrolase family protein [Candidatus Obscuribacterales bacterium]